MPDRLTPEAREQIRQRAEAATPGPWHDNNPAIDDSRTIRWKGPDGVTLFTLGCHGSDSDAAYIASVDPTTILSLLAELDAEKHERAIAEAARDANGAQAQKFLEIVERLGAELDALQREREEARAERNQLNNVKSILAFHGGNNGEKLEAIRKALPALLCGEPDLSFSAEGELERFRKIAHDRAEEIDNLAERLHQQHVALTHLQQERDGLRKALESIVAAGQDFVNIGLQHDTEADSLQAAIKLAIAALQPAASEPNQAGEK